ncbi:His Kinase A (phospho-acceptor) domain-containing protein [Pedobacter westerhofensis]|uniref:histidine kinase n=1 Tax=Pedobacter westerhofensis TaxID=425512 RepID=A0A521CTZ0_9SPHI|nr:ATP-binding protein [Pedobacter westerhofensis]SMO62914.1 His Kinase A (phospho-acceptor) domain-containing protein [Pedobacter westerhofensis]
MISKVRKIPILRYAIIVCLIVVLFISAFYLYLYYRRAESVRYNVHQMILARESAAMIDNCLISLYSADNNSRLYGLTSDTKYFNQFSADINFVNKMIGQLNLKNQPASSKRGFQHLINEKTVKTESYTKLKLMSDSLLNSTGKISTIIEQAAATPVKVPVVRKYISEVKIDTIKPQVKPLRKKRFFGRVFDAFSARKSDELMQHQQELQKAPTVIEKRIATRVESRTIIPKEALVSRKRFQEIYQTNHRLRDSEQEILKINTNLIAQIIASLKEYKSAEQHYIASGKAELNDSLQDVVFKFKSLSGLIFIFLITMVIVILYNIWKIFRNEEEIISYSLDAEQYALSKSAFLASMSHEIRTPLNSVIGFSEQLSQSRLDETQKEQLEAISSSSRLLLDVVNEILDFSKFETGKMSFDNAPFVPHDSLEEVFNSLRLQAEHKGIRMEKELNLDEDICLKGDAFRLKQVVINLMSNAIKFTTEGKVVLRASITEGEKELRILHVAVQDSGLGISKENIPLIFGEFAQIVSAQQKASQKGTGLGLAISKKIVELQGGSISVSSEPGKGSVFTFHLPMERAEMIACRKKKPAGDLVAPDTLSGKHILVAEDNKLNVLLLTTILKKWNITFDVAEDGVQAFELFEAHYYDLVLTDIEMPELGGVELAGMIRKYQDIGKSYIPILALTANALKEDRDHYISAGMNGVILKPFSEQNLLDTINEALKDPMLLDERV